MSQIKINSKKRIGEVIFVVEGRKTEPRIITDIFNKVLGFSILKVNSNNELIYLKKEADKYSKITIVVSKHPQIKKINDSKDFLDDIFKVLVSYNLDPYNSAIYFIFDRDKDSNLYTDCLDLISKLVSSRDNPDYNINGMLLLSYPCVEAIYCNMNSDDKCFCSNKEIKKYVNENRYKNIESKCLIDYANQFIKILNDEFSMNMSDINLDNLYEFNNNIFLVEEDNFYKNKYFITLSLVIISLLDLGIIEIEWYIYKDVIVYINNYFESIILMVFHLKL